MCIINTWTGMEHLAHVPPAGGRKRDKKLESGTEAGTFGTWQGPSWSNSIYSRFHNQVLKLNPRLLEDKASAIDASRFFVRVLRAVMWGLIRRRLASGLRAVTILTISLTLASLPD